MALHKARVETVGDATLYLGDCRKILPDLVLADADSTLLLTDPPYGIAHRRGAHSAGRISRGSPSTHGSPNTMTGDDTPFDPTHLLAFTNMIVWGADHYVQRLPDGGRWLIWDKTLNAGSGDFSDFEVAWCSKHGARKIFRYMWMGIQKAGQRNERRRHPTEKPVALYHWCLSFFPRTVLVVDPYMGSGSCGAAAMQSGLSYIGIEIDEKHFETALARLRQEAKNHAFFKPDAGQYRSKARRLF